MIGKVDPELAVVAYETPIGTFEECSFVSFIVVV
jgi:hypothetical protein